VNLNAVEIEPLSVDHEETKDASDFEEIPETDEPTMTHEKFATIYLSRRRAIPAFNQLLKGKASPCLPYLITSNLASFLFYCRYHNGSILDVDPIRLSAVLIA
jgi:hypothetical protein